jgi:hypothetical protein
VKPTTTVVAKAANKNLMKPTTTETTIDQNLKVATDAKSTTVPTAANQNLMEQKTADFDVVLSYAMTVKE